MSIVQVFIHGEYRYVTDIWEAEFGVLGDAQTSSDPDRATEFNDNQVEMIIKFYKEYNLEVRII